MQNSMMMLTFSVFHQKNPFRVNFVQKISLSWNLVSRLIRICRIQWWCSLFLFMTGNTLSGEKKTKLASWSWNLVTRSNSNMHDSVVQFTFSVFARKYPFSANFVWKIKIVILSWNLVPRLIRICRIQLWCSFFLFLTRNTLFW